MIRPLQLSCLAEGTIALKTLLDLLYQELILVVEDPKECYAIIKQLLSFYFPIDTTDFVLNTSVSITPSLQKALRASIRRLKKHEPVQYVTASTSFKGNHFKVTPDVFIPRPETEEWVTYLIGHLTAPAAILDIGTGSGCIAITLKQQFPQAVVDALDSSPAALDIAAYNATQLGVTVNFIKMNILTDPLPACYWSLIVSNPPYVCMQEKKFISPNVLNYEPHIALFVDDKDPLLFYKHIAYLAWHYLTLQGTLCLEINERLGKKIVDLLHYTGFKQITLHQDIHAKERWVIATR